MIPVILDDDHHLRERTMRSNVTTPFTDTWFASGEHLGYDMRTRAIERSAQNHVFVRLDGDVKHAVTFMPGFPDGSIGWAKVLPYLPDAAAMPMYGGMPPSTEPASVLRSFDF